MPYKPSGFPCDLYREHVLLNPASFAGGTPGDTDDFRTNSRWDGETFRPAHLHDNTAYPGFTNYRVGTTQVSVDGFPAKLMGTGTIT